MHRFDHSRPDFKPYGFTCELWIGEPMRRADRHNEIELNLIRSGSLTYLFGGQRITLAQGGLGAFWAAIPHQIVACAERSEYFVVTLPLAWFLQCRLPNGLVDRLLHGQFVRDRSPERLDLDLSLFRGWAQDMSQSRRRSDTAFRLELHARLLRLSEHLPPRTRPGSEHSPRAMIGDANLSKAERLATYIAQHCQEPILISQAAREVGLHPNYAMSLFKKTFNLTLNEFLTQHRMSHAQRLLATTDAKVLEVALEAGYPTLSRFYAAFKKMCGCSPGRYRRQHRSP